MENKLTTLCENPVMGDAVTQQTIELPVVDVNELIDGKLYLWDTRLTGGLITLIRVKGQKIISCDHHAWDINDGLRGKFYGAITLGKS